MGRNYGYFWQIFIAQSTNGYGNYGVMAGYAPKIDMFFQGPTRNRHLFCPHQSDFITMDYGSYGLRQITGKKVLKRSFG